MATIKSNGYSIELSKEEMQALTALLCGLSESDYRKGLADSNAFKGASADQIEAAYQIIVQLYASFDKAYRQQS